VCAGISLIYTSLRLLILILLPLPLFTCSRARFQSFPQLFLIYYFFFGFSGCLARVFPLRAPNAFNFDEELSGGAGRKSRELSAQKRCGNGTESQRARKARKGAQALGAVAALFSSTKWPKPGGGSKHLWLKRGAGGFHVAGRLATWPNMLRRPLIVRKMSALSHKPNTGTFRPINIDRAECKHFLAFGHLLLAKTGGR